MIETEAVERNEMTNGTKNHGLQNGVVLAERSVVGDDDAYLTEEI